MRQHEGRDAVSQSLIDTARFRKLLKIDVKHTDEIPDNEREIQQSDRQDDSLVITARLPRLEIPEPDSLREFELNPGFDPYNNSPPGR